MTSSCSSEKWDRAWRVHAPGSTTCTQRECRAQRGKYSVQGDKRDLHKQHRYQGWHATRSRKSEAIVNMPARSQLTNMVCCRFSEWPNICWVHPQWVEYHRIFAIATEARRWMVMAARAWFCDGRDTVLQFYGSAQKSATIHADASQSGLECGFMQQGRPMAFASRGPVNIHWTQLLSNWERC